VNAHVNGAAAQRLQQALGVGIDDVEVEQELRRVEGVDRLAGGG